ncbi:MAG: cob(I)yrinic acid a,c-diamide adenosyltransferase [Candidatus Brockarchaeota archaeon]|nr:cob(I)yrinic acid a,c-diamide adenosyltransferase [Candidatus Brockarchaeota archaeon]MBO3763321.1 cob(I)yrinic acid a,c-diamide adenosyltransferase [Candidatus Brockarchaeota archaeon]MBO3768269.1 cob(I)yrinic acid a,c-diamide adenosyltransferase [Candidatus Brockarchaeota archaeon]MBO3800768.1 cob(I)yrinic acid a,c-diamide adenosyltransferase [Candidatus Brockarchaeota archaeon]
MKMGKIFLYTGTGPGKTTNAIGLAIRTAGHGLKAVIIFFMKGRKEIGEYAIQEKLKPFYEAYLFGTPEFIDLKNPRQKDKELAKNGLNFAREKLKEKPHLLVLDEINLAVAIGLLDVNEVLKFLDEVPEETDVVLTGRYAPPELINRADVVNVITEVKYPKEIYSKIGITY